MEIRPIFSALMRNKTAPLLVAIQVAISLAILSNALYIVQGRLALAQRPSGIADESSVIRIQATPLNRLSHEQMLAQQEREKQALRAIPGVASVAWTNQTPLARNGWQTGVAADRKQLHESAVASNYFTSDSLVATFGLRLSEGRDFVPADYVTVDMDNDNTTAPKVVLVTQALAQQLYPGAASVVGKPMYNGTGDDADELRIIGVIERFQTIGAQPGAKGEYSFITPMRVSTPYAQYVVRTEPGQRDRVMREAETVLRKLAPGPETIKTKTVEQDRKERYRNDKALSWMLVAVCGLLTLVTASGIVGMTTLWVAQRRKQIGVRRALGARRVDITRYFLTENLLISSGGIFAGVLLALALNQLLVSTLELARLPVDYLAGGAVVLWLLGLAAVYGPAWKAASIAPAVATRTA